MKQGYSGSQATRKRDLVVKKTSDVGFARDPDRQRTLKRLSGELEVLPTISDIKGDELIMEYIPGEEGLSTGNVESVGEALRYLHGQTGYPFPVSTGTGWLRELASQALSDRSIEPELLPDLTPDPGDNRLIHTEPVQVITKGNGTVVFIDIEGIGMGSRYQDLGFIYYSAALKENPALFELALSGYGSDGVDMKKVNLFAGVIALAYSTFAESTRRIDLGLRLLRAVQ